MQTIYKDHSINFYRNNLAGNIFNKNQNFILVFLSFFCLILTLIMINPVKSYGERIITLHQAYLYAAKLNGTIKSQRESYYQSTLLKWSAVSMLLPNISLTYKDQRFHSNLVSSSPSGSSGSSNIFSFLFPMYEYSFSLTQPLLNIPAIPAYYAAENSIKSSKMSLNNLSQNTLFSVAKDYYNVLSDENLVKADKKTMKESLSHLQLAKAKLKAGLAIITDVLQAKAEYYQVKQQYIAAINQLKSAKAGLRAIIGVSFNFQVVKSKNPRLLSMKLSNYIKLAYKYNPGLKSIKFLKKESKDEVYYYETQYIPTINFEATYNGLSNNHFIPQGNEHDWTAAGVLTFPIFQGGSRMISIEKARSKNNANMYNLIQAKRNLRAYVVAGFYNIQNLKYQIIALKHEESYSYKNYKLVEEEYKAGVATSVDIMTALADLASARHNLLAEQLDYYTSILNFKTLTGSFKRRLISLKIDRFKG
ncbi:MAG: TolC family protein [bacterium]